MTPPTDIGKEPPPMPTLTQALDHGRAWEVNRQLVGLRARLALAERLLTEAWTQHRLIADMEKSRDDVLTYLEFRKKENQT